ncbi:unnamed protein product [Pleuronectes platessa]|uniref:Uncharacterized protein n=1 Tax=Pleuronectes platessa TaxID=8262 RepID=A0A9N7YTV4_PLEPL|nr:unnamed protein product [Pleuronectes platessa]
MEETGVGEGGFSCRSVTRERKDDTSIIPGATEKHLDNFERLRGAREPALVKGKKANTGTNEPSRCWNTVCASLHSNLHQIQSASQATPTVSPSAARRKSNKKLHRVSSSIHKETLTETGGERGSRGGGGNKIMGRLASERLLPVWATGYSSVLERSTGNRDGLIDDMTLASSRLPWGAVRSESTIYIIRKTQEKNSGAKKRLRKKKPGLRVREQSCAIRRKKLRVPIKPGGSEE